MTKRNGKEGVGCGLIDRAVASFTQRTRVRIESSANFVEHLFSFLLFAEKTTNEGKEAAGSDFSCKKMLKFTKSSDCATKSKITQCLF